MKVYKRNGDLVQFERDKIANAIYKAMAEVDGEEYDKELAKRISKKIEKIAEDNYITNENKETAYLTVEQIQDLVEEFLMASKRRDVARAYVRYRYKKEMVRQSNTTDQTIKELLEGNSEYWNTENSNKNSKIVTVQRDYIAGITSTDIARRFLLPKEVCEAHDAGIIHQHDMDYLAQNALNNCCLINLDDMLRFGTVINGVAIDPQKRITTAATVATQIITAVASSQYGGTTISLAHLAPYVRGSYEEHYGEGMELFDDNQKAKEFAKNQTKKDIKDAVQTFNYQINSMSTTNG